MTTTKEYRTELRNAMRDMDGAEKLRAIRALRAFVPLAEAPPAATALVLGVFGGNVSDAPTIRHILRLIRFLETMLPRHLEADHPEEVEATLGAVEDILQEDQDRRKASQGEGG